MSVQSTCPTRAVLSAFGLGTLPEHELEEVADHVTDCERCAAMLAEMDADTDFLVRELRRDVQNERETQVADSSGATTADLLKCPGCRHWIETPRAARKVDVACSSCGAIVSIAGQVEVQLRELGRFVLLEVLGAGGFGTVYRARDPKLDREVAVKVPRAPVMGSSELERFRKEARNVAQLAHPGIVPIYEVGESGDVPYLVSELVRGRTLADRLSEDRPSFRESAELVATLCDVLQVAHDHGIVHRDVKPSNVMLDLRGAPRLMDFGLASRDAGEITLTLEGQVLGTPAYLSPEQAQGDSHAADRRSDVYSLGVTLFELLTGELPFRGSTRMVLRQVIESEPGALRALNDRVPRDLETICLKAMAKERHRRYQTAHAMAADLRAWLEGRPIQARPVGRMERAWRWCKRKPLVAGLIGATVVLLVSIAAVSTAFFLRERANRTALGSAYEKEKKASEEAIRQRDLAQAARYRSDVRLGAGYWQTGNVTALEALLRQHQSGPTSPFELRYLQRLLDQPGLATPRLPPSVKVNSIACSPANSTFATAHPTGHVRLWDALSGKQVAVLRQENAPSADVTKVLYGARGDLLFTARAADNVFRAWDLGSKKVKFSGTGCVLALSPDGQRLATASQAAGARPITIHFWNANDGKESVLLRRKLALDTDVTSLAFSADGKTLAVAALGMLYLSDVEQMKPLEPFFEGVAAGLYDAAFSPDGRWLALTRGADVELWEWKSRRRRYVLKGHRGYARAVAFLPGHPRYLVSAGVDQTVRLWDFVSGHEVYTFKGLRYGIPTLAYSAPAKRLLVAGAGLLAFDLNEQQESERVMQPLLPVRAAHFSPDGSNLAFGTASGMSGGPGQLGTWNRSGNVEFWQDAPQRVEAAELSPDRKTLAVLILSDARPAEIDLWSVEQRKVSARLKGLATDVFAMRFSADGKHLATAGGSLTERGGEIALWDVQSRRTCWRRSVSSAQTSVVFAPDGESLIVGGADKRVTFYRRSDGVPLRSLADQPGTVLCLTLSPDGKTLAVVTGEITTRAPGQAQLWDVRAGQPRLKVSGHKATMTAAAFSSDGRTLATAGWDGSVKVWNAATAQLLHSLDGHVLPVEKLAFLSANELTSVSIAPQGTAQEIKTWDLKKGAAATNHELAQVGSKVVGLTETHELIIGSTRKGLLALRNVRTLRTVLELQSQAAPSAHHEGTVLSLAHTHDGKHVITGSRDRTIIVWDAKTWKVRHRLRGHRRAVVAVVAAPKESLIASASPAATRGTETKAPGAVKLWSPETGKCLATFEEEGRSFTVLAISPDGKKLAAGATRSKDAQPAEVYLWDLDTKRQTSRFAVAPISRINALAFAPDGLSIVIASAGKVTRWNHATGSKLAEFSTGAKITLTLAFSPDGKTLATGEEKGLIRLRDASTLEELVTLPGHVRGVRALTFSPDGSCLASGSEESLYRGEFRIWRASSNAHSSPKR